MCIVKTKTALAYFLNSCQAKGLSNDTIRWYKGILNHFAKTFYCVPLRPEYIDEYLISCKAGDERKHGYYRAIRVFYNYLHKRYSVSNVVELVDAPKRIHKEPRPLTPDYLDQLLSYPHKEKIKAGLLFLIDTGARVGEAARIKSDDIIETPWGYIVEITGKTGSRLVPISIMTYNALIKTLPFGYSVPRFRRLIAQAFRDAHVPGTGINLRHTFGTLWNGDELILQQIMGHKHLSTTKIYRALRTERISEQHNKYSPLKAYLCRSRVML